MTHSNILAIKHSCFNHENNHENYICVMNKIPEKCLKCNETLENEMITQLLPPYSNAHQSILFTSYPLSRIAFISSDSNSNISNNSSTISSSIVHYQPNTNLHCGVVDSQGKVYHYTNQYGIQYDTIGWEQSIIINVSEVTQSHSLTSFKWNEIIYSVVNNFKQSHPNRMIQHDDYDCLDFIVDIIKYAIDDQQINRILIAQWLSIHLEWIILYENIRKQLESGSLQVISKLHHIV